MISFYPPVYLVSWGVLLHLKCASLSKQRIRLCFTLAVAWEDIVTCSLFVFFCFFWAWLGWCQVFKMDGWPDESWLWPAVTRVLAPVSQFLPLVLKRCHHFAAVRFAPINVQANHMNCDRNAAVVEVGLVPERLAFLKECLQIQRRSCYTSQCQVGSEESTSRSTRHFALCKDYITTSRLNGMLILCRHNMLMCRCTT